jgi:hypothetical protein
MTAIMSTTAIATTKTNDAFTRLELDDYNSYKIWLEGIPKLQKKVYKTHLSLFCKYHSIDPGSLIQLKPDQIKTMVLNYIIHLKKIAKQSVGKAKRGEISVNSVKDYLADIQ